MVLPIYRVMAVLATTSLFFTGSSFGQPNAALQQGLEAHGGIETWRSFVLLTYDLVRDSGTERHTIDLHARRTLQRNDAYTIGYDGKEVWITPNAAAYSGNPRFYNGLYFYFFSIPFVLADSGINYETLPQRTVDGKTYDVVKISYDAGIGDSPDDNYFVHLDPATHQVKMLLYTVTYNSRAPSERFSALVYDEWQEVDGLLVPAKMTSYRWNKETGALGDKRAVTQFQRVAFSKSIEDETLFAMPTGAEVLPAPSN